MVSSRASLKSSAADEAEFWGDPIKLLRPKERLTVSQYAARYRYLSNEGGGFVGRWNNEVAPYLVEPMDCLDSLEYLTVAVVGPGQCGKTEIAQNWLLKSTCLTPGNIRWFMQSKESLDAFVKTRIDDMIENHPVMKANIGHRTRDDNMGFKKFKTMDVEFLTATSGNLINKSAPRIVADEIDAYAKRIGNVKPLLDVRRQTYKMESMLLLISHPDLARGMNPDKHWNEGIMSVYADSDRRVGYWECPHCKSWSSPAPTADRHMDISYNEEGTLDEIEDGARLVCPVNGCLVTDDERLDMIRTLRWVGIGQEMSEKGELTGQLVKRKTAGFWIVGPMSPFVLGGIGALARARVKAEREYENSGEDKTLKEVMVKQWGYPYVRPKAVGDVEADELARRTEKGLRLKEVPPGGRFITAAVDVQARYFDVLMRAWGARGESWVIDHFRIPGTPASNPDDWDKLIERVILAAYPLAGRSDLMMPIRGFGYDSGGAAGVTRQANDAWLRWMRAGHVKRLGKINGRDVYTTVPLKGASGPNAQRLAVVYPDTTDRKDRKVSRGNVPLGLFNPNMFKDDLSGQLQKSMPGPWMIHFPGALKPKHPPYEFFEQLVSEKRLPNGKWEKSNSGVRNEVLDLMVMTHIMAHLHGIGQINWKTPPSWAAPWDENDFLITAENVASLRKKDNNAANQKPEPEVKIIVKSETKKTSLSDKLA